MEQQQSVTISRGFPSLFECLLLVCTLLLCSHFSHSLFKYLELVDLGPLLIQYIFEAVNGAFICCLFFSLGYFQFLK